MVEPISKEDCKVYRKTFRNINSVLFVFLGVIMTVLVGAAWSGYSAKADLNTHKQVQAEHDKHIDESLIEIKAMLNKLGEKLG